METAPHNSSTSTRTPPLSGIGFGTVSGQARRLRRPGTNMVFVERAPKYLNGAQSPLFSKGEHLFGIAGLGLVGLERGARAVLVEGPLDAVAITAGTGGRAVGAVSYTHLTLPTILRV